MPVLLTAFLWAVAAHAAPTCRTSSAALTRPLVELYTSEGCSSCPPADRWLAAYFDAAGTRSPAVALAFHVDYWDRLGWVDRFADAAYTERQYGAMRANGASFVYTPQVLLQGHDLAGWGAGTAAIEAAARQPARATVTLEAEPAAREVVARVDATVADATLARDARLFVAYADSGLASDVKAGENRGARLTHDHVVRALRRVGAPAEGGRLRATIALPVPREAGTHPTLVAFVQRATTGDVLQTVALPLDRCALP